MCRCQKAAAFDRLFAGGDDAGHDELRDARRLAYTNGWDEPGMEEYDDYDALRGMSAQRSELEPPLCRQHHPSRSGDAGRLKQRLSQEYAHENASRTARIV